MVECVSKKILVFVLPSRTLYTNPVGPLYMSLVVAVVHSVHEQNCVHPLLLYQHQIPTKKKKHVVSVSAVLRI